MPPVQFTLPPIRYLVLGGLGFFITLHLILGASSDHYNSKISTIKGSLSNFGSLNADTYYKTEKKPLGWDPSTAETDVPAVTVGTERANASFVVLARNTDVWEIVASIRAMEDRFNHKYNYPWVFLNDNEFDETFKLHTTAMASGKTYYGKIDRNQWDDLPAFYDIAKANQKIAEMSKLPIPYVWSWPYRKMCRYQSGFFWRHPLLDQFKYYWRVEPSVKFFCDIDYDPFMKMQKEDKKYGFVLTVHEYQETVATLWDTTKKFIQKYPEYVAKPNMMKWISDNNGETYNLCHFWSNFEIASLDFWRGEAYTKYFEFLDEAGGFFYERWGDAPVHSIAAALFLKPEEIHFFSDIGYRHEPFQHCPQNRADACACDPGDTFENHGYSCTPQWKRLTTFINK